jgi:hypothetical protein
VGGYTLETSTHRHERAAIRHLAGGTPFLQRAESDEWRWHVATTYSGMAMRIFADGVESQRLRLGNNR